MPQAPAPQGDAYKLYSDQNYSKGQSQFPKFWSVWGVRNVPPANFTNTPLIDRVIRDGKMYLSLSDAVALALENNLDIAIQRYNLVTADVDILRTASGAAALGVNAGLVQGTPGGILQYRRPPPSSAEAQVALRSVLLEPVPVRPVSWLPPRVKVHSSTTSIRF